MNQTKPQNETVCRQYVTSGYLQRFFHRGKLTILLWKKNRGLPYVLIPGDNRDAVRYDIASVREWARDNGIDMYRDRAKLNDGA